MIKTHDVIIAENLQVKKMLEKKNNHKHLRKEITNATFSEIIRVLKYKCNWLNKILIQVKTYYASSQICSGCGNKESIMKDIRVREYTYKKCKLYVISLSNLFLHVII